MHEPFNWGCFSQFLKFRTLWSILRFYSLHCTASFIWCNLVILNHRDLQRFRSLWLNSSSTGKSFSEALILASVNPQYDKRLFSGLLTSKSFWFRSALKCSVCRWHTVCNNICVDRSKIFENNPKIVDLDILFSCLQTLDLATLMLLHTAPPTQTAF